MDYGNIFNQSIFFILACGVLGILVIEAALKINRPWAISALVGYATIGAWYLLQPLYSPDDFAYVNPDVLDAACIQVIEFLVCLRLFIWMFSHIALESADTPSKTITTIPVSKFLGFNALLWLLLISIGVYRMNGDLFAALLPIGSRAGVSMWMRGAAGSAGESGFLVATASYLYTLVCASFGILLPLLKRRSTKLFAISLILISWPYFLLQGARNEFLAIFLPSVASYLLFSHQKILIKCTILGNPFLGSQLLVPCCDQLSRHRFGVVP